MDIKFLHSDNGTLIDYSSSVSRYTSGSATLPIVASEDYLYIGVRFPLNSILFKMEAANTQASNLSVNYWTSSGWTSMVEVSDDTSNSGATLGNTAHIDMVPNKTGAFLMADTDKITGLESVTIYDRYWYRLSFSADLDALTTLSYVGMTFSEDADLGAVYPDLNTANAKSRFESGKTSWEHQHVLAAEFLIDELIHRGAIDSGNQILVRDNYRKAAAYKVAELIYDSYGSDYEDDRLLAEQKYLKLLDKNNYKTDKNNDAILNENETTVEQARFIRG